MKKIIYCLFCVLLLTGCTATTDPSKGGLFSYSPEAYKERAAVRQDRLAMLQREQIAAEQQQEALTQSAAEKQRSRSQAQQKLQQASRDVANLKKTLDNYKANNAAQEQALEELKARRERLQGEARASNSMSPADRQVEAERLRKEIKRLSDDLEALSSI